MVQNCYAMRTVPNLFKLSVIRLQRTEQGFHLTLVQSVHAYTPVIKLGTEQTFTFRKI